MKKAVVLTSVKALIWPFATSTLGSKQSDKVMDLCYSLEQCVKGEESQQEEEEHRTDGAVVDVLCCCRVEAVLSLYCAVTVLCCCCVLCLRVCVTLPVFCLVKERKYQQVFRGNNR